MNIILPNIDCVFDCGTNRCCSVIIENQQLLYKVVEDISKQIDGYDGKAVLSQDNTLISFAKKCEIISQFVPFDMNSKGLLTKISSRMQQLAVSDVHHIRTNELLATWENYLMDLSLEMVGNIEFTKVKPDSLIKASGITVEDNYQNLGEKLLDYFELVREYDADKLFILINIRSYLADEELEMLLRDVLAREIQVLLIDSSERRNLSCEKRYIIDADLCVIC